MILARSVLGFKPLMTKMWYNKMHCGPYQQKQWYGFCRVCRSGAVAPDDSYIVL